MKRKNKFMLISLILALLVVFEFSAYATTSWEYVSKPYIYSRSSWGARSPQDTIDPRGSGDKLIFHHTGWNFSSTDFNATKQEIRDVQDYHMDNNGWSDIGYHYIIDRNGRIWEGRDESKKGSHTYGYNDNIGIVNLGDYEGIYGIGAQQVTLESYGAMCSLAEYLTYKESLDLPVVYIHGEFGDTACPGRNMATWVFDDLRAYLYNNMVQN